MDVSKQLHDFLLARTSAISEEWLNVRKETAPGSFYHPGNTQNIDTFFQNSAFLIKELARMLIGNQAEANENLTNWANALVQKRASQNVPLNEIIEQFKTFRIIFLSEIEQFVRDQQNEQAYLAFFEWNRTINKGFDSAIELFSRYYYFYSLERLSTQQEMIRELSAPVILIKEGIGVIPLIGDIDPRRAQIILTSALEQCTKKEVKRLFIDLSGVALIDTMVAQQIFQVVFSLDLIGVKSVLSGIRPEVAQTAVQLGIDFTHIEVEGTLLRALAKEL